MTDQLPPPDSGNDADQWDAVARFLAGESAPAEATAVRHWLAEHPDDAHVVAKLDSILATRASESFLLNTSAAFTGPLDVEGALDRVHTRMRTPAAGQSLKRSKPSTSFAKPSASDRARWRWQVGGVAAAAALMLATGVAKWQSFVPAKTTPAATYATKIGTADSITLPDSSVVVLAPGSRLIVAANYGGSARDVTLQGAGQFTVRHDAARPFTVHAGSAVIRDLGTVFGVKSSTDAGITVSVSQGSVALSDSSSGTQTQRVELKAGDRGRVLADGSVRAEPGTVTPDELSWVTGTLVYHDATLAEVQADLRRWYGVELVVRDSALARRHIESRGLASEPVGKILERMASLMGGVVTVQGDSVFIDKAGDRSRH